MIRNILFWMLVFINYVFQIFGQVSQVSYELPAEWFRAGNSSQDYEMGLDYTIFYGKAPSGFIKSRANFSEYGFGILMQEFFPKDYLGKQVRLTCTMKYNNVLGWTGILIQVYSINGMYDDMRNRKITGTSGWKEINSIVNVPEDTTVLAFGILLSGEGTVWLDECSFELMEDAFFPFSIVNPNDGNSGLPTYPTNLSF
ncbi:hypothetical protein RclHR1_00620016 [Rhizophagus clarus]|nr:hypothetical protein RclHR1_00620016 [Rhizophagus clarus]